MKHFYLVENNHRNKLRSATKIITNYLKEHKCTLVKAKGYANPDEIPKDTDCIIVMGGDGTMIRTATDTLGMNIPMIGIKMGRLGYLCSISQESEIIPMLKALIKDDYTLEKRMLIEGHTVGKPHKYAAMNEVVVGRKVMQSTIRLKITVNNHVLNEYTADGIIITTPTGSSAYNLAAGGPIVEPDLDLMVITPICPHKLVTGSIVISGKSEVGVEVVEGRENDQIVVYDGLTKDELPVGSKVMLRKSKKHAVFVRLREDNFVKCLQDKIK